MEELALSVFCLENAPPSQPSFQKENFLDQSFYAGYDDFSALA